jgi:5'-AMP-activated protein kinase, catalytic alpha subunit
MNFFFFKFFFSLSFFFKFFYSLFLKGYLPFEDPNTSALYKKILAGDYSIPNFVSKEGKDLIKGILNTDPQKRFTIADIRKHSWYN